MKFSKVILEHHNTVTLPELSAGVQLFSSACSELAEGPLWHQTRCSLCWVDILTNRLYEKSWNTGLETYWQLPFTVSSIAQDAKHTARLWLVSEQGLCWFDMESGELVTAVLFNFPTGYRTNDGSVSPDGRYWFGTMLRQPKASCGQVFSVNSQGELKLELEHIAIPNTFCWLNAQQLLITDSLQQVCQRYALNSKPYAAHSFLNLASICGTPDGGAVDASGNIWIAIWGASKVLCVDNSGAVLREISLPVPQPSSCCFGGPNNDVLFITSAREGLNAQQLVKAPDSGRIFAIKLALPGAKVNSFSMD